MEFFELYLEENGKHIRIIFKLFFYDLLFYDLLNLLLSYGKKRVIILSLLYYIIIIKLIMRYHIEKFSFFIEKSF